MSKYFRLVKPRRMASQDQPLQLSVIDGRDLEIKLSTIKGANNGLFALRDYAANEPITQYYGQLITHKKAIARRQRKKDSHIRMHIMMQWCIDGAKTETGEKIVDPARQLLGKGGGAIANHKIKQDANARYDQLDREKNQERLDRWMRHEPDSSLLPEERITFLRATKPIRAGDEIFADYGKQAIK